MPDQVRPLHPWAAYTRPGHRPMPEQARSEATLPRRLSLCAAAAVAVVTAVGLQNSSYEPLDQSRSVERLNPSTGGVMPLPKGVAFQFANYKVLAPADGASPGSPSLLKTLSISEDHVSRDDGCRIGRGADRSTTGVGETPGIRERRVLGHFARFAGSKMAFRHQGPQAPRQTFSTLTLLLKFLLRQLPEMPPARTQQGPAPVEVVDVQRAAVPTPVRPPPYRQSQVRRPRRSESTRAQRTRLS